MTKTELIKKMAEGAKISLVAAENALAAGIAAITEADKTQIKGFGTFEWKKHPARTCRNPKTGASVEVPESTTLKFKASASLKNL